MSGVNVFTDEYMEGYTRAKRMFEAMSQKMKTDGAKDSDILARITRIIKQVEEGTEEDSRLLLEQLEKEWL